MGIVTQPHLLHAVEIADGEFLLLLFFFYIFQVKVTMRNLSGSTRTDIVNSGSFEFTTGGNPNLC